MCDTSQRAETRSAAREHRGEDTGSRSPSGNRSSPSRSSPAPPPPPPPPPSPSPPPAAAAVRARRPYRIRSIIWRHCTQRMVTTLANNTTLTFCNYCSAHWNLYGSTSVALRHLREKHPECFTEADEDH